MQSSTEPLAFRCPTCRQGMAKFDFNATIVQRIPSDPCEAVQNVETVRSGVVLYKVGEGNHCQLFKIVQIVDSTGPKGILVLQSTWVYPGIVCDRFENKRFSVPVMTAYSNDYVIRTMLSMLQTNISVEVHFESCTNRWTEFYASSEFLVERLVICFFALLALANCMKAFYGHWRKNKGWRGSLAQICLLFEGIATAMRVIHILVYSMENVSRLIKYNLRNISFGLNQTTTILLIFYYKQILSPCGTISKFLDDKRSKFFVFFLSIIINGVLITHATVSGLDFGNPAQLFFVLMIYGFTLQLITAIIFVYMSSKLLILRRSAERFLTVMPKSFLKQRNNDIFRAAQNLLGSGVSMTMYCVFLFVLGAFYGSLTPSRFWMLATPTFCSMSFITFFQVNVFSVRRHTTDALPPRKDIPQQQKSKYVSPWRERRFIKVGSSELTGSLKSRAFVSNSMGYDGQLNNFFK